MKSSWSLVFKKQITFKKTFCEITFIVEQSKIHFLTISRQSWKLLKKTKFSIEIPPNKMIHFVLKRNIFSFYTTKTKTLEVRLLQWFVVVLLAVVIDRWLINLTDHRTSQSVWKSKPTPNKGYIHPMVDSDGPNITNSAER